eukprot:10093237-Prorocentrum_lima.AAC.1
MTSSLVGSEMCIRDRYRSLHVQGLEFIVNPPKHLGLTIEIQWITATPFTVSYTHLTLPTICSV